MARDYMSSEEVQALRNSYDEIKKQQEAEQRAKLEQGIAQYENQRGQVNAAYDDFARQAYINKVQNQRDMEQRLSARGYSGGLSETSNLKLNTDYEEKRNQNQVKRLAELNALDTNVNNLKNSTEQAIASANATTENQYQAALQNLLAQLKQEDLAREQAELERERFEWQKEMAAQEQRLNEQKLALQLANTRSSSYGTSKPYGSSNGTSVSKGNSSGGNTENYPSSGKVYVTYKDGVREVPQDQIDYLLGMNAIEVDYQNGQPVYYERGLKNKVAANNAILNGAQAGASILGSLGNRSNSQIANRQYGGKIYVNNIPYTPQYLQEKINEGLVKTRRLGDGRIEYYIL